MVAQSVTFEVARGGYLAVLQWAWANGCDRDAATRGGRAPPRVAMGVGQRLRLGRGHKSCIAAVAAGHLVIL
jgi:hypothetical protein